MEKNHSYIVRKIVNFVALATILLSLIVWGLTEGLSVFCLLNPKAIRMAWAALAVLFLGISIFLIKKKSVVNDLKYSLVFLRTDLSRIEMGMLLLGLCMTCGTFFIAYVTVPFNWDSMTYHLARVGSWIQNASVEYYPTNNYRQLYYSSFMEYFILHICLIFGNDKLVNLVQWCGYVVSAIMVYGIADEMGLKRKSAFFSTILFMLCPLAIAESATTQVDLVGCMWVLIFIYYALLIGKRKGTLLTKDNIIHIILCGTAIGFGYLTKASVCFMMPAFLVWIFIGCLKEREKIKSMFICCIVSGSIILGLAMPGFVRNYKGTSDIFAMDKVAGNLMLETCNPKYVFLNFCKNMTLEVAETKEQGVFWSLTMKLAELMDVDIEDPEISAYTGYAQGIKKRFTHDHAGAQSLFVIVAICLLILMVRKILRWIQHQSLSSRCSIKDGFLLSGMGSVLVMFCCIRWQPWGTRLLLPTLPVLCIFIGYMTDKIKKESVYVVVLTLIMLVMAPDAVLSVKNLCRYAKPAIEKQDRFYLYFLNRGEAREYVALCEEIQNLNAKDIGMFLDGDTYEWPLWVKLKNKNTKLGHVVLEQEAVSWYPECIAAINRDVCIGQTLQYGEKEYQCIWNYEDDSRYALMVERP